MLRYQLALKELCESRGGRVYNANVLALRSCVKIEVAVCIMLTYERSGAV